MFDFICQEWRCRGEWTLRSWFCRPCFGRILSRFGARSCRRRGQGWSATGTICAYSFRSASLWFLSIRENRFCRYRTSQNIIEDFNYFLQASLAGLYLSWLYYCRFLWKMLTGSAKSIDTTSKICPIDMDLPIVKSHRLNRHSKPRYNHPGLKVTHPDWGSAGSTAARPSKCNRCHPLIYTFWTCLAIFGIQIVVKI